MRDEKESVDVGTANCRNNSQLFLTRPQQDYCVLISAVSDDRYYIEALVDSGSKISIIKESTYFSYFSQYRMVTNSNKTRYGGVNKSLLTIHGFVDIEIRIHLLPQYSFIVTFAVVPDSTMLYDALLGRDFIMQPGMCVTLSTTLEVKYVEPENEILKIDVGDENTCLNLVNDICCYIPYGIKRRLTKLLEEYWNCHGSIESIHYEIKIDLIPNARFKNAKRAVFSGNERKCISQVLNDLLSKNIIRPSKSVYTNSLILDPKKDGSYHFRIDYRHLNKVTVKDRCSTIFSIYGLIGKSCFTKLVLKDTFQRIAVAADSIKYTSFTTPNGKYEYLKMPFGLLNGPSTFHKYISLILTDLITSGTVFSNFNEIVIATLTIEENLKALQEVLHLLAKNQLELRLDKCTFFKEVIRYLGYTIGKNKAIPEPRNITAILDLPIPKTVKQVQSFLGLTDYFQEFIFNYFQRIYPLTKLENDNVIFHLDQEEQQVFDSIKENLISPPLLSVYSKKAITEVHVAASKFGFGAILMQRQDDGLFHPVFYFNRRTSETENRYNESRLHTVAITSALSHFHVHLTNIPFTIVIDYEVNKLQSNLIPRHYGYKIERRGVEQMRHVGAICSPVGNIERLSFDHVLACSQLQDPLIRKLHRNLKSEASGKFELRDGVLYRKTRRTLLLYVPAILVRSVVLMCHEDGHHITVKKAIETISIRYWFPNMRQIVEDYVQNCSKCRIMDTSTALNQTLYYPFTSKNDASAKSTTPFEIIHASYFESFQEAVEGYRRVLLVVDDYTKYVVMYPLDSATSAEIASKLSQYFVHFGCCKRLVSSKASYFMSNEFARFIKDNGILHIKVSATSSRNKCIVNYEEQCIRPAFRKLCQEKSWRRTLPKVQFELNNICPTGINASRLLFGCELHGFLNSRRPNRTKSHEREEKLKEKSANDVRKLLNWVKKVCDRGRHEYDIGDCVMVKNYDCMVKDRKMLPKFSGPYVIAKNLARDCFLVTDVDGMQLGQKPFSKILHARCLKLWVDCICSDESEKPVGGTPDPAPNTNIEANKESTETGIDDRTC